MSATIELKYPIKDSGVELRHLSMRRPKVRDFLAAERMNGSNGEKEIRTFANLCELSPEAIEDLDMADYKKLQDAYQGFLS